MNDRNHGGDGQQVDPGWDRRNKRTWIIILLVFLLPVVIAGVVAVGKRVHRARIEREVAIGDTLRYGQEIVVTESCREAADNIAAGLNKYFAQHGSYPAYLIGDERTPLLESYGSGSKDSNKWHYGVIQGNKRMWEAKSYEV